MTNFDNSNRGAIWRNKDKQEDKQPDFKGSINVAGVDYWISGWQRKEGDNPKAPVIRFSVQPKEEVHNQGYQQTQQSMQPQHQAPQNTPSQQDSPYLQGAQQQQGKSFDDIPF